MRAIEEERYLPRLLKYARIYTQSPLKIHGRARARAGAPRAPPVVLPINPVATEGGRRGRGAEEGHRSANGPTNERSGFAE